MAWASGVARGVTEAACSRVYTCRRHRSTREGPCAFKRRPAHNPWRDPSAMVLTAASVGGVQTISSSFSRSPALHEYSGDFALQTVCHGKPQPRLRGSPRLPPHRTPRSGAGTGEGSCRPLPGRRPGLRGTGRRKAAAERAGPAGAAPRKRPAVEGGRIGGKGGALARGRSATLKPRVISGATPFRSVAPLSSVL